MKPSDTPYLGDIQVFLAVAETGTYEAAAEKLDCSQSTISRSLIRLSEWLGRVLTTDDRPHELTEYGRSFIITAREIVRLMQEVKAVIPDHIEKPTRISGKDIKI